MNFKEVTQNLGNLSNARFDVGRGILTHPVLDDFKGQAQPLHFFISLFQGLEDVIQSFISRKSLTLFIPPFQIFQDP